MFSFCLFKLMRFLINRFNDIIEFDGDIIKQTLENARKYIKVIDSKGSKYQSQEWHYLIAYTKWKEVFGNKCGTSFSCVELLLYLYEVINDIPSIVLILNTCIREKDERAKFVKRYDNSENSEYTLNI